MREEDFRNMIGVGFMASMISLPVISCCKLATFFGGGHAPSAMFGVKVNIAFGGSLCFFVTPHLVDVIGVGFMGSMISLPVINYYEHTYHLRRWPRPPRREGKHRIALRILYTAFGGSHSLILLMQDASGGSTRRLKSSPADEGKNISAT